MDKYVAKIMRSVTEAGLAGAGEAELLRDFCRKLNDNGLPLSRALVLVDTLHPIHEGRAFRWRRDQTELEPIVEYGRTNVGGTAAENWLRSPFYKLVETGETMLRCDLRSGEPYEFPVLAELREEGNTDHAVLIHRFAAEGTIGEMDCIYSSWTTDDPTGFSADQIEALQQLAPTLALAIKCASLTRIAETLVQTYLGRDAGRRVLNGGIARTVTDRIDAVIWFSDLRGFTRITETAAPEQIIPFLNDYSEAIISSIHESGGDVLKLIGDGTLAIFQAGDPSHACQCALKAERLMRTRIETLNTQRAIDGIPLTDVYLGLHIGAVFYGNIGSQDRLDFTVVGPAVNEATRIATLCSSIEKDVLISSAFAAALADPDRVVSVGRYALKGVKQPQELFTLEPVVGGAP